MRRVAEIIHITKDYREDGAMSETGSYSSLAYDEDDWSESFHF